MILNDKRVDDLREAGICSNDQSSHADQHNNCVDEDHTSFAKSGSGLPVGEQFDQSRESETKGG